MNIQNNFSLFSHNTFGIDTRVKSFIEYSSEDELRNIINLLQPNERIFHIGSGSNLVFTTDYFQATILHSTIVCQEIVDETEDYVLVRVGSGVVWDDFVAYAVSNGWGGVENLSLIPGEVGASAVQNIGAYGVEAKDVISVVEAIELRTGQKRVFGNAECNYGYRDSIFKHELKGAYAITYVTYKLSKHPVLNLSYGGVSHLEPTPTTIAELRQAIIDIRNAKLPDPKILGNAGSFFMNPVISREKFEKIFVSNPQMPYYEVENGVKIPAGWLIEQCGWKGKRMGTVGVYEKQALIIVNHGGATGADILALVGQVYMDVKSKFDIELHTEVNYIS